MTTTTTLNSVVPSGHFVVFRPAADQSVDDEYEIHNQQGDTGVAIQIGDGFLCATFHHGEGDDFTVWHWWPREWDQMPALRADIAEAFAKKAALR